VDNLLVSPTSPRLVVVVADDEIRQNLTIQLDGLDAVPLFIAPDADGFDAAFHPSPGAVTIVALSAKDLVSVTKRIKSLTRTPVLAVVPSELFDAANPRAGVDDFCDVTASGAELKARVRRLFSVNPESGEVIRRGDLAIDTAMCEVSLGGQLIELTFKEYELLKFLATHPGRVHSRDVLLDRVWGYDYYGGDRTVDVHIRRLRSKIEDANHSFIDTVRNVGYRFRRDV